MALASHSSGRLVRNEVGTRPTFCEDLRDQLISNLTGLRLRNLLVVSFSTTNPFAARFAWTHEIPARRSDITGDRRLEGARRISLTFRQVIRLL